MSDGERTSCIACNHPLDAHPVDPETGFRTCRSVGHSKGLTCAECERLTSSDHHAAIMAMRNADDPLLTAAYGAYKATRVYVERQFGDAAEAFFTDVHQSAVASALIEYERALATQTDRVVVSRADLRRYFDCDQSDFEASTSGLRRLWAAAGIEDR